MRCGSSTVGKYAQSSCVSCRLDLLLLFYYGHFQYVLKEIFAWSVGLMLCKDVLKSVIIMYGALYVMILGTTMMLWWCVDSWDTPHLV